MKTNGGLGLAIGLVAMHIAGTLAWQACTPTGGRIVPATTGRIRHLAIQYHRDGGAPFLEVYAQLFSALDPSTRITVVVGDPEDQHELEASYARWFPTGDGPQLDFVHTGTAITSWMRDRLAVVEGPALFAPPEPMKGAGRRVNDFQVPWTLGGHLDLPVHTTSYRFEGGDLIASEDALFIASPLLARNPEVDESTLVALLQRDFGRPVVVLHDTPEHHLGMFVTPLGGGRVAVADPTLVAVPEGLRIAGAAVTPELERDLDRFEGVARQVEEAGFEVVRLPVVPTGQKYAWMSYNNVLAETRDGALHVYMPTYGVPMVDDVATDAWTAVGAVVHPIDVQSIFRMGGSVRCLTAPLIRED